MQPPFSPTIPYRLRPDQRLTESDRGVTPADLDWARREAELVCRHYGRPDGWRFRLAELGRAIWWRIKRILRT